MSLYAAVQKIATEAGAIEECEYHSSVFITCYDADAEKKVYAIATNKMNTGEISCNQKDLMATIKSVINDAGAECGFCEKWDNE